MKNYLFDTVYAPAAAKWLEQGKYRKTVVRTKNNQQGVDNYIV
jgi:hypothetical protein